MAETRSGCLGLEWREGACLRRGIRELLGGDANTLFFFYCGVAYTTVCICQNSLNCTLKMDEFYINFIKLLKIS